MWKDNLNESHPGSAASFVGDCRLPIQPMTESNVSSKSMHDGGSPTERTRENRLPRAYEKYCESFARTVANANTCMQYNELLYFHSLAYVIGTQRQEIIP